MSNQLQVLSAAPGQRVETPIPVGLVALKVSNTSPYDLDFSGFGVIGDDVIPSGTEHLLFGYIYNSGTLITTLQNNRGISPAGNGVILLVAYYSQDEIPKGYWPVSIPTSAVQVSNVVTSNTLVNNGNNPGTTVINIQPSDATSPTVVMDNSGNFTIYSDNAGVLTLLLKLIAGANPAIQIGASTITTEILGNLLLDNNENLQWRDTSGNVHTIMFLSTFNNVVIRPPNGTSGLKVELQDETGTSQLFVNDVSPQVLVLNDFQVGGSASVNASINHNIALGVETSVATQLGLVVFPGVAAPTADLLRVEDNTFAPQFSIDSTYIPRITQKKLSDQNGNNLADWSAGGLFLKTNPSLNGSLKYQSPSGTTVFSVTSQGGTVSACGSGTTISHGMGVTPTTLVGNPVVAQPGSGTVGSANFNSTTFRATIGAGTSFIWYGIAF